VYVPELINVVSIEYVPAGVTELEAPDALDDEPYAVVALTVNVYAVPDVSPLTVIGDVVLEPAIPPGLDVAVYVTVPPFPVYAGAVNSTVALVAPVAVTVPTVGAPGLPPPPETDPKIGKSVSFTKVLFYIRSYSVSYLDLSALR
jgi:hypothetical protein